MSEMEISRQTKKMLLFVSPENTLWAIVFRRRAPSQNEIADYMDVSHGTIPGWKNGGQIGRVTADLALETVRRNIGEVQKGNFQISSEDKNRALAILEAFRRSFYDNNISIYLTAEHLGMTIQQSQKIIDDVIYKRGPIFPRMYAENAGPATSVIHTYQGVYMLWVRRRLSNGQGGRLWLQAPLRVRYVLQIGAGWVVRCKLNAPMIDPEPRKFYWEYDGFLVKKHNRIFWLFEKRERDWNDQFHFITGAGRTYRSAIEDGEKKSRTMSGVYLTTEQDESQTIASDKIILQRVAEYTPAAKGSSAEEQGEHRRKEEDHMKEIMHSAARPIEDEALCSMLDHFLEEFERRAQ